MPFFFAIFIVYKEGIMKLYTKKHVIISSLISASLAFIFAFVFIFLGPSYKKEGQTIQTSENTNLINETNTPPFSTIQQSLVDYAAGYTIDEQQNILVYENFSPAVVNISTEVISYSWFSQPYPTEGSSGSGSIIDARGYVVTNRHVVANAYKIYVSLSDGTQYEGKVIGVDAQTDIAVIKFDPPKNISLKTISYADSNNLKVGQKVIAIGNPFGFDRTMTTGIISSLGRPIQIDKNIIIKDMIQTDSAINPGNSGGPLLDSSGKMIGINTMIYSTSGSSAGVGFAVPVNTAKRIVSDIMQYGYVNRGSLNGSFVELNATIANYANISIQKGLLVSELPKNSNLAKAGIKAGNEAVRYNRFSSIFYIGGDIITEINGTEISSLVDLNTALEQSRPGDLVQVGIQRGKQNLTIPVSLSETTTK